MALTKQTHRTAQKHTEHVEATDIQNKLYFVFFGFFRLITETASTRNNLDTVHLWDFYRTSTALRICVMLRMFVSNHLNQNEIWFGMCTLL